jgi:mono/diheme cytochrome c family protein
MTQRRTTLGTLLPVTGLVLAGVLALAVASSCNGGGQPQTPVERGRRVFAMVCSACHNLNDPTKDGSQGPGIAGSSLELLQAKVLRNEYPPGYTPKRDTKQMAVLPLSEAAIADVHAWLQQAGQKGG